MNTKVFTLNFVEHSLLTLYLIINEISRAAVASRSNHGPIMFQKPGSIHCTEIDCNVFWRDWVPTEENCHEASGNAEFGSPLSRILSQSCFFAVL